MNDRRRFLSALSLSLAAHTLPPLPADTANNSCWLEVAAPFLLEDAGAGLQSELVLTSDTFAGVRGYEHGAQASEYEICLYDATGKPLGADGVTRRLRVPAMHATVLPARELRQNPAASTGE
jgi:hypothetical protein